MEFLYENLAANSSSYIVGLSLNCITTIIRDVAFKVAFTVGGTLVIFLTLIH